jgi:tripartite-type tricarboxylate transporter receptor subunit TctC
MSGQVEIMLDAITTMVPMARAGRVRALGTTGLKRSTVLPDVPTISEAGVKGYETTIWLGLMAPTGTPKPVIDRLNAEVVKIIARPDVKKAWNEQGAEPMSMTPTEFEKYLNADIAKWAKVVKSAGMKPE